MSLKALERIDPGDLPKGWSASPPMNATRIIRDEFVKRNQSLILRVPSAVVPGDYNYLVNPAHRQFEKVRIVETKPFRFDSRLFGLK